MTNTWADGLNPSYAPMSDTQAELFAIAVLSELQGQKSEEMDKIFDPPVTQQFLIQILDKRIEAFKLPISFTPYAKMAVLALTSVPGDVVVLLIDCLNAFEGREVTTALLADLYPMGFYDEPTLVKYVDDYMKPRKVKWSDVYVQR